MKVGAFYVDRRCEFTVWAPHRKKVTLVLSENDPEIHLMKKTHSGYWKFVAEAVAPGTKYKYLLDETLLRADPASHFQPNGVHGFSAVVDHNAYSWKAHDWQGIPLERMVFYELHVGTFTREGTFHSTRRRLKELSDLGINAIEIMPIAQFAGNRNWGYDGVYPYAVQNSYGTPDDLKCFVDKCHLHRIAVVLDIVFNHIGPEGNYLGDFGPYFNKEHKTIWGPGINFDGPFCSHVRNYFLECAFHWIKNYHIDGFRLDAVHAIIDNGPKHFIKELAEAVNTFSMRVARKICLVAESDLNDSKIVRPRKAGGFGIDAQWLDDFHHSLHVLLTGERYGYYADFSGIRQMLKAFTDGYVYSGQYSKFRGRKHGDFSADIPPCKFVVFSQNHDQIGNRKLGERLAKLAGFEAAKLAAGIVILSPYVPLLFMGEEYADETSFFYFTSFKDRKLAHYVSKGRKAEFIGVDGQSEPPDPQSTKTFRDCKLKWRVRYRNKGKKMLDYYRCLIGLRTTIPALSIMERDTMRFSISRDESILYMDRWRNESETAIVVNFDGCKAAYKFPFRTGRYRKILDSADKTWGGPGSKIPVEASFGDQHLINGHSMAVFVKTSKGEES